ncbi:MAG: hypothetical protein PVH61_39370 [Candidatus Aminicenantes bacterium]|jgi:hypothetical protein
MEVIREIKTIKNKELIINLPDDFLNKEVEITIAPLLEKSKVEKDKRASFFKFVEENQFKLPGDYKFVREELYDR